MKKIIAFLLVAIFCSGPPVPVHAMSLSSSICAAGSLKNDPPVESVPTYSYAPDGLLEFHFVFKTEGWPMTGRAGNLSYTHYYPDCSVASTSGPLFGYSSRIASRRRVVARVTPTGPDLYNFALFDEDSGEALPNEFGIMPGSFSGDDIIAIDFWSAGNFGTPDWLGSNVSSFSTAAVAVKINLPHNVPVLIIPGVMGTELWKQDSLLWPNVLRMVNPLNFDSFMDPLQFTKDLHPIDSQVSIGAAVGKPAFNYDYTSGLMSEFSLRGYTEGYDLFLLPYDWRYGISDATVQVLKDKIDAILTSTGMAEIDIVAHSTGGLLVKKYAQKFTDHHIRKAIMVGVPNLGAPQALKVLLQGDNFGVPGLKDSEMKKISQNLPVVYDLLPSSKYLAAKGSYVRVEKFVSSFPVGAIDLTLDQTDEFILNDHQLNAEAYGQAQSLHSIDYDNFDFRSVGIDVYNIAGCKRGTMGTLVEQQDNLGLGTVLSYNTPRFVPGDGTVPLESATNLPVNPENKYYALKADHGIMLSQDGIRQAIADMVMGSVVSLQAGMTQDITQCKLKGKAISIYSPVAIEVTTLAGERLGLLPNGGIENSIANASVEIMSDHTFIYLPEEEIATATIRLTGTGTGKATVQIDSINGNSLVAEGSFRNISVTKDWLGELDLKSSRPVLYQKSCLTSN